MHTTRKHITAALSSILLSLLLCPCSVNADTPDVLVTLKPLHSLVSALMLNIAQPELLLDNLQSPHDYTMKPSDRRRMNRADIIIYTNPDIEGFIPSILNSLTQKKIINLSNIPKLNLLQARAFDSHKHDYHHIDGHIWLSIDNAIIISQYLSNEFLKIDAANTEKYKANRNKLTSKLKTLKAEIQQQTQPLRQHAFLMFHDAFQYFEYDFKLTEGLFVTSSPDHKAGIRHIASLKKKVHQKNIRCVFYEPPHIPNIIQTITAGSHVKLIALEPLGIEYPAGPEQYFMLLKGISNKLYNCMQSKNGLENDS